MTIDANSYGDTDYIAYRCPKWTDSSTKKFTTGTVPTLTTVEKLVDEVSAVLNIVLESVGFTVPVPATNKTWRPALNMFTEDEVCAIIEGIHGSGRFGPTTKGPGKSRFGMIGEDAAAFIAKYAPGGANAPVLSIGYRDTDNAGDDVAPIFQRDAFSNDFDDDDPV